MMVSVVSGSHSLAAKSLPGRPVACNSKLRCAHVCAIVGSSVLSIWLPGFPGIQEAFCV